MPSPTPTPDRVTRLLRIIAIQANLLHLERHLDTRGSQDQNRRAAYQLLADRTADLTKSDNKRIFQAAMSAQALIASLAQQLREIAARQASAGNTPGHNAGLDRLIARVHGH